MKQPFELKKKRENHLNSFDTDSKLQHKNKISTRGNENVKHVSSI